MGFETEQWLNNITVKARVCEKRPLLKDVTIGNFRGRKLHDGHLSLVELIYDYRVVDSRVIMYELGLKFNKFKSLVDECIDNGLLAEYSIQETKGEEVIKYHLYTLDTAGYWTIEETGIGKKELRFIKFTTPIEKLFRYWIEGSILYAPKIALNQYEFYSYGSKRLNEPTRLKNESEVCELIWLEDWVEKPIKTNYKPLFVYDLDYLNEDQKNAFGTLIVKEFPQDKDHIRVNISGLKKGDFFSNQC